jgi:stage V sporulation protein G
VRTNPPAAAGASEDVDAHKAQNTEEYPMVITDIKVRKLFDEGPMKAIVSVTFDGQLAVHDIKVINARDKYFIVMPSRKNPDNTYRDIVHPINAQFRAALEEAVIDAYNREVVLAAEAVGEADVSAEDEVPAEV